MILILRGHIRDAFNSADLYNIINEIYILFPDLQIYIHTWNVYSNGISWRKIETNNNIVDVQVIYNYFRDLQSLIRHVIIDDDKRITLIGKITGNINNGPAPLIGWKNYWYGQYKIIDYIYNLNIPKNINVLNLRFDILTNSNKINSKSVIDFVQKNSSNTFTKNVFTRDEEYNGIDNIYIGNINTMHKLAYKFFYDLDNILDQNQDTIHQEKLVYRINGT
jgi:hypothetical protein